MHHACFANVKNSKFPIHHPIDYEQFLASGQRNKADGEAAGQTSCAARTGAVRCGGAVRRCRGFTAEPVQPDLSDRHGISPCNGYHGLPEPIPHQNWFSTCGDNFRCWRRARRRHHRNGRPRTARSLPAERTPHALRHQGAATADVRPRLSFSFGFMQNSTRPVGHCTRREEEGASLLRPTACHPRPASSLQPPDTSARLSPDPVPCGPSALGGRCGVSRGPPRASSPQRHGPERSGLDRETRARSVHEFVQGFTQAPPS